MLGNSAAFPFNSLDNSTFANLDQVVTNHLNLSFDVNFTSKNILGDVVYNMQSVSENVSYVQMDLRGIVINEIQFRQSAKENWSTAKWIIQDLEPTIGKMLNITVPSLQQKNQTF